MNENLTPNDGSIQNVIEEKLIEINKELKDLIYPLTSEEYQLLEKSIIDEGCRDAIILWNKTIIDGHNRYEICTKNNISFKTTQKDFENILFAKEWILINQFSRRNLNDFKRSSMVLKLKDIEKEIRKLNQKRQTGPPLPADHKKVVIDRKSGQPKLIGKDTRDVLADLAGVSHNTIDNVEKIEKSGDQEIIDGVESGHLKISDAALLVDKDVDEKTKDKVKKALELIDQNANDATKESLMQGKKSINEALSDIKKDKKAKQLEKKKEIYIEQAKAVMVGTPKVSLMDAIDFLNTFEDDSIDLLFTDPPYMTDIPNIGEFTENWLTLAIQKTKKSGRMLVFSGSYPIEIQAFLNVLLNQDKFIVDNPLIWTYKNTLGKTPNMKYNLNYQLIWHLYSNESAPLDTSITSEMFSVQEDNAPDGRLGNRLHAWQKSDELSLRLVRHTSKLQDLVVDPFTCTGTFIIAANKLGRVGQGCDIDQTNLNIAIARGCELVTIESEVPEDDNVH